MLYAIPRPVVPVALLLCVAAPPAGADWLDSTLMQPVREVEHVVGGTVRDGVLHARVRRSFVNTGEVPDEVVMGIDLPEGASAVGLRLRAGTVWHEGKLLDANEAGDVYQTLTGLGVAEPRDPVLLQWSSTSSLLMQVFPVLADGQPAAVEYDLAVPMTWEDGAYRLDWPVPVPEPDSPLAQVRFEVTADDGSEVRTEVNAGPTVESAEGKATLHVRPHRSKVVARLGRATAGTEAVFTRLQVEAPARLSSLPAAASVVFLIDGSWSIAQDELEAQLALARGWLRHVPDSRFEVVVYSRDARSLAGHLQPRTEGPRWLDSEAVPRGNGSDLGAGLRQALAVLASAPAPRRLLVFTDDLLASREGLTRATDALRAVPPELIVHIIIPQAGAGSPPVRDDAHRLASLAQPSGGVLYYAEASPEASTDELAVATLPLVRPVQIDHLSIEGLAEVLADEAPAILEEGAGFRLFDKVSTAPAEVTLRGQTWSMPWTLSAAPDPDTSRLTAGWAFSEGLTDELSRKAQLALAHHAGAVSPVTSYLAIEPGASPSTAGIPDRGRGIGGMGMAGHGSSSCGIGHRVMGARLEQERPLDEQVADALAACGPLSAAVQLEVETTRDEIVDVVWATSAHGLPPEQAHCLEEALWAHRVDASWARFERRTVVVALGAEAAPGAGDRH